MNTAGFCWQSSCRPAPCGSAHRGSPSMRAIGSRSAAKKRRVGDGGAEPVDSVIVLRDSGGEAASGAMERKMLSMLMTRTEDHRRPLTRQAEAVDRRGRTARLASWTAAALWTEHLALHLWARGLAAAVQQPLVRASTQRSEDQPPINRGLLDAYNTPIITVGWHAARAAPNVGLSGCWCASIQCCGCLI